MRTQAIGAGFEGLEERLLLAGNVTSVLAAGVLVLDGDGSANQVQLTVASNGQLTATGLSGTTIDGVASKSFGIVNTLTVNGGVGDDTFSLNSTVATFTNDVTIDGGIGNDTISVTGQYGADLVLDGGTGLDTISVSKAIVAVDINIDSGGENDKVTLSGSTAGRDVVIQSGLGNDSVTVGGMAVLRDLSLTDTGGNNALRIVNSTSRGDTLIVLDAGNDSLTVNGLTVGVRAGITALGLISIDCGDGNNLLSMSNVKTLGSAIGDGILVTSGIGNDVLSIMDSQSGGLIQIDSGAGGDRVELARVTTNATGALGITTGLGTDSVKLDRVIVGGIGIVDTGLGDDILQITNSRFTGVFNATAGDGNDVAYVGSNFFATTNSSVIGGLGIDAVTRGSNSPVSVNVTLTFENTRYGSF